MKPDKTTRKTKISELLKNLSETDFRKLGDFLRSPFFNKGKLVIRFYEYIDQSAHYKSIEVLNRKELFRYIYPGEAYKDSKMRSLVSDFIKLTEKFLIYNELDNHFLKQQIFLLDALMRRNISGVFEGASNELSKELNSEFNRTSEYYIEKFRFETNLLSYEGSEIEIDQEKKYIETSNVLDNFFILSKLKIINSLLSRKYQVFGNIKLNFKFTNELIEYIKKNLVHIRKEDPIIFTEYMILMMMFYPNKEKYFSGLLNYVLKNISRFNQVELEEVYYPLCNYCFNKIATGQNDYLKSLFKIYRNYERINFYVNKETLQDMDFLSIILTGLKLKKTDWTEKFLSDYRIKIPQSIKNDTIHLAQAQINFFKRNYKEALHHVNEMNYKNSYYYLKAKEIQIYVNYEQENFNVLSTLIDTTKHYLRRHKEVLFIHYNRYLDFLNFISRLLKSSERSNGEVKMLLKDLKKNKNAIGREWLIEKAGELTSGK